MKGFQWCNIVFNSYDDDDDDDNNNNIAYSRSDNYLGTKPSPNCIPLVHCPTDSCRSNAGKMRFKEMIMMMVAIVIEIMKVMIVIEIMMMMTIFIDSPDLAHSTINLSPLFSFWIICWDLNKGAAEIFCINFFFLEVFYNYPYSDKNLVHMIEAPNCLEKKKIIQ